MISLCKAHIYNFFAIGVIASILLYILFGFIGVPLIIRHGILSNLNEQLSGNFEAESIHFNPFTFKLVVKNMNVTASGGEKAIRFREFRINYQIASIFSDELKFKEIYLSDSEMDLVVIVVFSFRLPPHKLYILS